MYPSSIGFITIIRLVQRPGFILFLFHIIYQLCSSGRHPRSPNDNWVMGHISAVAVAECSCRESKSTGVWLLLLPVRHRLILFQHNSSQPPPGRLQLPRWPRSAWFDPTVSLHAPTLLHILQRRVPCVAHPSCRHPLRTMRRRTIYRTLPPCPLPTTM